MERRPSLIRRSSVAHPSVNPVGLRAARRMPQHDSRDVIVVTAGQHDSSDSSGEKKSPLAGAWMGPEPHGLG